MPLKHVAWCLNAAVPSAVTCQWLQVANVGQWGSRRGRWRRREGTLCGPLRFCPGPSLQVPEAGSVLGIKVSGELQRMGSMGRVQCCFSDRQGLCVLGPLGRGSLRESLSLRPCWVGWEHRAAHVPLTPTVPLPTWVFSSALGNVGQAER